MKVRTRNVLEQQIQAGITLGLQRARKHTDAPTDHQVCQTIEDTIWEYIDEFFEFEE
jgi:hypothetical protein